MKLKTSDLTGSRVHRYRLAHPYADHWARSKGGIPHTIETQNRVFRMVDHELRRRDKLSASEFFHVLRALDDAARWETGPNRLPTPSSASAMGLVGYKILFGKLPPVRGHDWPADCELTEEAESDLATLGLRAQGFEPIVFDSCDPAAYIWALWAIDERKQTANEAIRRESRPAAPARGLAVTRAPVRHHAPTPIPLRRSLEPVGMGR
jgi:hypothetical protein